MIYIHDNSPFSYLYYLHKYILKYIVGNSYNNNHLTSILDWFWMKSAGSQTVLAPSFPQNGTLTENVTR